MKLHPRHAVSYIEGHRRGNELPAILWIWILVVALVYFRRRTFPTSSEGFTLLGMTIVIVILGSFLPTEVVALLVAFLVAGVLNVPGVGPLLTNIESRVAAITGG